MIVQAVYIGRKMLRVMLFYLFQCCGVENRIYVIQIISQHLFHDIFVVFRSEITIECYGKRFQFADFSFHGSLYILAFSLFHLHQFFKFSGKRDDVGTVKCDFAKHLVCEVQLGKTFVVCFHIIEQCCPVALRTGVIRQNPFCHRLFLLLFPGNDAGFFHTTDLTN